MRTLRIPISGQVTGMEEAHNAFMVGVSQHYGGGPWMEKFEKNLAKYTGFRHALMTNSGSSANLLAVAALELPKRSRILTSAVNFPTTVSAIILNGHIPVFVDADPKTLNAVDITDMKADAGIFAHTLGNPMDIPIMDFPIIEDCCDALGSMIHGRMVGGMGVMSTLSFYPAHHITTGEGGAVLTDWPKIKKTLESYRDWGRGCWCKPGTDNTCGTRFDGDYDHKYTYDRPGYNLKASEFQAAIGLAQLEKADRFILTRRRNWAYLRELVDDLPIRIIDPSPDSYPSWFGFAFLTERRNELQKYLDSIGIGCRPIMAGNIIRQKMMRSVEFEVIGSLDGANQIHEQGIWVGCFHGLTLDDMTQISEALHDFYK